VVPAWNDDDDHRRTFNVLDDLSERLKTKTYAESFQCDDDAFPQRKLSIVRDKLIRWHITEYFTKYSQLQHPSVTKSWVHLTLPSKVLPHQTQVYSVNTVLLMASVSQCRHKWCLTNVFAPCFLFVLKHYFLCSLFLLSTITVVIQCVFWPFNSLNHIYTLKWSDKWQLTY